MDEGLFGGLVALSLVPPLLFALYMRAQERYDREPMRAVLAAFAWGGTIGVFVAVLLHILFAFGYEQAGGPLNASDGFLAAVIIAPIVEELAKGMGLTGARKHIRELEDGIVYGTGVGLGFAATENLVYGVTAMLEGGFGIAFATVTVRIFSSMLLHASASGLLGFGYGRVVLGGGVGWQLVPYYLTAVVLHALFNLLVSTEMLLGLLAAIIMVATVIGSLQRRIRQLDALPHTPAR